MHSGRSVCFVTALVSTYKNIGFCYVTGQPSWNMSAEEEEDLFLDISQMLWQNIEVCSIKIKNWN